MLQFVYPVDFPVVNYDTIISLAHWSTSSFYHGIIELVPMFFVFSHLPSVFKAHPIAVELFTVRPTRLVPVRLIAVVLQQLCYYCCVVIVTPFLDLVHVFTVSPSLLLYSNMLHFYVGAPDAICLLFAVSPARFL